MPFHAPPEAVTNQQRSRAKFPGLAGWWNPRLQPTSRPALAIDASGKVVVCRDCPTVVAARRAAMGLPPALTPTTPRKEAAVATTGREEQSKWKPGDRCGTPGCFLPDFHAEPCTPYVVAGPRRAGVRAKTSADVAASAPTTPTAAMCKLCDDVGAVAVETSAAGQKGVAAATPTTPKSTGGKTKTRARFELQAAGGGTLDSLFAAKRMRPLENGASAASK